MTEKNFNYERFTHAIYLNASAEKVFECIASSSGICRWFIGSANYFYKESNVRLGSDTAQKGDSFLWKWLNKDLELKGMVLESVPGKEFTFTFSPMYRVSMKLSEESGRTKLTLMQEYQVSSVRDDFNYINCCVCWAFFLTNLKSVLEHDTDLREKEIRDDMMVNY